MRKTFYSLLLMCMATLGINAQESYDASDYFTGNPYGWATVSDEAGTAYNLDGALRNAQPKTIVLTSTGADMYSEILSAIGSYDIIVFDGSKGDFIISSQIPVNNAKNKTIVGRNNARLCTEFYLTTEDINYLNKQNLSGLSSVDQYTGTLPNGTTVTCDERAFFTKKAMMELQYQKKGAYTLPNNAGIFMLSATDENIIIRNITFQGPGAVDIDGSDLITNQEATHVWVDHCTFIDGQDGCLDSKRCDYASYTWNKFYYTSRTFSHPYTNGCGWVDPSGSMMLHLTFANNEWGKGCGRRLPQCGSCYVHLFNNYHNCPSNSAGITLNDDCTALVEGNYATSQVNLPLTGSGSNRLIYAHDNNFSYTSTSTSVTVPYDYDKSLMHYNLVPKVLEATHGAGATLEDYMPGGNPAKEEGFGFYETEKSMPKGNTGLAAMKNLIGVSYTLKSSDESVATVDQTGKITAVGAGTATITASVVDDPLYGSFEAMMSVTVTDQAVYTEYKLWNFKRSTETTEALSNSDWSANGENYTLPDDHDLSNEALMIDESTPYAEAAGLLFTSPKAQLVSYKDRLRFYKGDKSAITIPDLLTGDKVTVKWKSANNNDQRGFRASNLSDSQFLTDGNQKEFTSTVLSDGNVVLTVTGGIYVYYIKVERIDTTPTKISSTAVADGNASVYNLSGQRVSNAAKGIVIKNGKKIRL